MSEKSEKATPYKLQKAREKGQVPKSTEFNVCLSLLVLLGILFTMGKTWIEHIQKLVQHLMQMAGHVRFSLDNIVGIHRWILMCILDIWAPLAMALCISFILISIAQHGVVWSLKTLSPDWTRIHPVKGFRKLFSVKMIFDLIKNILKIILVAAIVFLGIRYSLFEIMQSSTLENVTQHASLMRLVFFGLALKLLVTLTIVAILDTLFIRWKYAKDQRMSKQEIKDEYRQREGDPMIKSRIKQLQKLIRMKSASLGQVKNADVLITNPQHLAIALKYDKDTMSAPKVICKASGSHVLTARKIARKYHIPIIENKPFARALFETIGINQYITLNFYPEAAEIYQNLLKQEKNL